MSGKRIAKQCVLVGMLAGATAASAATDGALRFREPGGTLVERQADLEIPPESSAFRLKFGQDVIAASATAQGNDMLVLLFDRLPYNQGGQSNEVLVLKGMYEPGYRYYGEAFTVELDQATASTVLHNALTDPSMAGFIHKGSFYFGQGQTIDGVPVVTGKPADPNAPCPYGPCWTDAGVGRNLEYYPGGPIQNPGHEIPPAGFNRGVPYSWTPAGQLAAEWVGAVRSDLIYRSIDYYANWGWGFWLFPWAIWR